MQEHMYVNFSNELKTNSFLDVSNTNSTSQRPNEYYEDLTSLESINSIYRSSINEFQMINPTEMNNSSMIDNSCVISKRTVIEAEERPILGNTQMNNCSKAIHVLCETKTLIVQNFQQGCFRKPLTLDLPSLISNRLTHELCVSVCRELQTKLSIIHINKCYCLNGITSKVLNLTEDLRNYQQNSCGNSCSGMLIKSIELLVRGHLYRSVQKVINERKSLYLLLSLINAKRVRIYPISPSGANHQNFRY
jgi:hypothetical protein